MYIDEFEIKETTKTIPSSASFLGIYFKFDTSCQLSTRLYDKGDHFNFAIVGFPHHDNNKPTASAYKFIFYNSYATLYLAVCIQNF